MRSVTLLDTATASTNLGDQIIMEAVRREIDEVCADLRSYVPGRLLDDNANVLLRYKGGASGTIGQAQVATSAPVCRRAVS